MEDATTWALIWLGVAAVFGIGEMLMAGSFFLLPFAGGGIVASLVTAVSGSPLAGLASFVATSLIFFFALRPIARRLDSQAPEIAGIGANRLIGTFGIVTSPISATPGDAGMVKVGTEEWRADSPPGIAIAANSKVRVAEVRGTRLIVEPTEIETIY